MKRAHLFSVLFIALIGGCTNPLPNDVKPPETVAERFTGDFSIVGVRSVIVNNSIGSVILNWGGSDTAKARWVLTRQVTAPSKSEAVSLVSTISINQDINGNTSRFYVQWPTELDRFIFSAGISVGVPFYMPCTIDGVQGTTLVADLGGDLVIRNANSVTVQRVIGSCDIASIDGGVVANEIAFRDSGHCVIVAVKGNITLRIPTNTSATVSARTTNGTISYASLAFTGLVQRPDSLTGTLGSGRGRIRLQTGDGNIVIEGTLP